MKIANKTSLTLLVSTSVLMLTLTGCSTQAPLTGQQQAVDDIPAENKHHKYDSYYGFPDSKSQNNKDAAKQAQLRAQRLAEAQQKRKLKNQQFRAQLKANAPKRYVVKKGDTLWDIAKVFLKDPTFWPEIWDKNQKIANPHLIYPGDKLHIFINKGGRKAWLEGQKGGIPTIKMRPMIRIERGGSTSDPINAIKPFMAWPRIVHKDDISSAPYIVDARDAKLLIENDRTIYVRGLQGAKPNSQYGIYKTGKEIIDPKTNTILGSEIIYKGKARITRPDEISTAVTTSVEGAIRVGDRLIEVDQRPIELKMSLAAPTKPVRGTIIHLYDANIVSGQRMVATINCGKDDGIKPGHILGVYSPPRNVKDPYIHTQDRFRMEKPFKVDMPVSGDNPVDVDIPPERVATMVIYDVQDDYAYAVITEATHEVKSGYRIGNP